MRVSRGRHLRGSPWHGRGGESLVEQYRGGGDADEGDGGDTVLVHDLRCGHGTVLGGPLVLDRGVFGEEQGCEGEKWKAEDE